MKGNRKKLGKDLLRKGISLVLVMTLVLSTISTAGFAAVDKWESTSETDILIKDTITKITDNVYEHEVITNNAAGNDQKIDYLVEISPSDTVKVVAGYGQDRADSWSLTPTTKQAAAYEKNHPGETVVAGINADFFNMATGEPMGALVMEGNVAHPANGRPYFGIQKDGTPVIRYGEDLSDLQAAVGGDVMLINNGQVITENTAYGDLNYSRTAIGIKEDGTIVTFVTYGNRAPISCGRTYLEIAQMLAGAGCVYALALDGGGSATYAGRPEGTETLEVRNSPGDGAERAVSSSLLVVSTAEKSGVFDHAQLSPNNEVYTPGSSVQFEAKGVDTAGFAMELPEGVTYTLAENSMDMGTIDSKTGLFTATDKTGVVTVKLLKDESVVGETTIEIVHPDHIYFASEEISLGFEEESDLGIVVRSKGRDVNYKDGDFEWTIANPDAGAFNGNLFKSSDGNSITTEVTATSVHDKSVSGKISVIVGKLPTLVWDFEDQIREDGSVIPAEDYYVNGYSVTNEETGETTATSGILSTSNYGRGGKQSIEVVSIDDDEPVFFGEKSLKLNYDFTQCGEVTEGACIGTTEGMSVPGTPTGIGVWVYAPEGVGIEWKGDGTQAGLWLRGYVRDGNGSNQPYDFTLEPKNVKVQNGEEQPGIYWEGWKYLEADLTNIAAPYGIQPGMTFRLMYVAGTKMGTKSANSIYFDNLQFVYGTNVDDVDNPVVNSITVNGTELEDGAELNTNVINVDAIISDVQNKYTTGIDDSTVRMYVDGINVVGNDQYEFAYADQMAHLYNVKLADGTHSVTVSMKDGFGNETTETRFFTVDTDTVAETSVEVVAGNAVLGGVATLQIQASDATVVNNVTSIKLGNQFKEYDVTFSENYDGKVNYSNLSKNITITAERKADAVADDNHVIATLTAKIPATLLEGDHFSYTVKAGSFNNANGYYGSYSTDEIKLPIVAGYNLAAEPIIVGGQAGVIEVTDAEGKTAPAGVSIYLAENDTLVGVTDETGCVTTEQFNAVAGESAIYAKDDQGALSFQYKIKSYDASGDATGLPDVVRFNAVEDPTTMKNITWLTNPLSTGVQSMQYAVSGSEDWKTAEVSAEQFEFAYNGFHAAMIHGALLKDLTPGTTYDYVIGTGDATIKGSFETEVSGRDESKFFIIPDIQDPDKSNLTSIVDKLNDEEWNFGVQIGDAIDQANDYNDWAALGEILGAEMLGDTDMVSVMGNHEYYGDGKAEISAAMYNQPITEEGTYYSVENGNIYMAVINFATTKAQIEEAAKWLVEDAAKSKATWKMLLTHQPVYYTNSAGGNEIVYEILPDAAEAAGIDVVFSGHDHAVGRTNLLKDDQIHEDEGILYYVTGAAGGKRYSVATQNIFDYNTVFGYTPTADYTATYLTASCDKDEMTIQIHDVNAGMLDQITIKSKCKKHGHEQVYDVEQNLVSCDVCGETVEKYTGNIKDAKGNEYYLLAGVMQKGWVTVGEDQHYYDANGIREEVKLETGEHTCIIDTVLTYTSASGEVKVVTLNDAGGHEFVEDEAGNAICSVCGWQRLNMEDIQLTLGFTKTTYNGNKKTPKHTAVNPITNEELLRSGTYRDYYWTFDKNVEVGKASITLTARKPAHYVNLHEWRGNYKDAVTAYFTIHPDAPQNVTGVCANGVATLSWDAAKVAETDTAENMTTYVVYQSVNGGEWTEVGATTETGYVVENLDEENTYRFRVATQKLGTDQEMYQSLRYGVAEMIDKTITVKASNVASTGKIKLTWNAVEGVEKYVVYRSDAKDGTYKYINSVSEPNYINKNAKPGMKYYYKVKAVFADGTDSYSKVVARTCDLARPNVKATNVAKTGKVKLSWKAVEQADQYKIYRSTTKDGTYKLLKTVTEPSHIHKAAKAGDVYYYKVKAICMDNAAANSAYSVVDKRTCDLARPIVKASTTANGKPKLTWTAVEDAEKYYIYRATSEDGKYKRIYTVKGTSFVNQKAKAGKTYYYRVKAVDTDHTGANSAQSVVDKCTCK